MKVAVVGATGMVGRVMMKVLEERNFPVDELIPVASGRSEGSLITFRAEHFAVVSPDRALAMQPGLALFSAGSAVSREWAPLYARAGTTVIDNSSAWRQEANIPLVVPEVNATVLKKEDKIIANPNCSTIQLVVALYPLHRNYGLRRVVVSTYQSVTGSGMRGLNQLLDERAGSKTELFYPHPIDLNIIPQGGFFLDNLYTSEEQKLMDESRKIMGIPDLKLTSTVVRVPVKGGHSESVNAELERPFEIGEVRELLSRSPGILVQDDPLNALYPMPLYAEGRDEVFVGRIRADLSNPNALNMWVVADNVRKGAATNAVQIAQYLLSAAYL